MYFTSIIKKLKQKQTFWNKVCQTAKFRLHENKFVTFGNISGYSICEFGSTHMVTARFVKNSEYYLQYAFFGQLKKMDKKTRSQSIMKQRNRLDGQFYL